MSIPNDVAMELVSRLETITKANGQNTDAGKTVFRGRRRLSLKSLPCIVLIERKMTPIEQSKVDVHVSAGFVIEGHSACDPDNPNDVGHDLEADIMRAVFTDPHFTYGAPTKRRATYEWAGTEISPHEDGSAHVSVAIWVDVNYIIAKGNP